MLPSRYLLLPLLACLFLAMLDTRVRLIVPAKYLRILPSFRVMFLSCGNAYAWNRSSWGVEGTAGILRGAAERDEQEAEEMRAVAGDLTSLLHHVEQVVSFALVVRVHEVRLAVTGTEQCRAFSSTA